jgi:hypothetical protein
MDFSTRQFHLTNRSKYLSQRETWGSFGLRSVKALKSSWIYLAARKANVSQREGLVRLQTWSNRAQSTWTLLTVGVA